MAYTMINHMETGKTKEELETELEEIELELKHLGSCTTSGLTDQEIVQLDERFFLATENLKKLKARRDNKPEGFF